MQVSITPKERILEGLHLLSRAVGATLGPAGQHVLIESRMEAMPPTLTKDGVTVARFVSHEDPVSRAAIRAVLSAAQEMNARVGDGTTSAVVLAAKLTEELLNVSPRLRRQVHEHLAGFFTAAINLIRERRTTLPAEEEALTTVTTLAANNDAELGRLVAKAIAAVGTDGVVTFQPSKTGEAKVDIASGLHFDRGYLSPYFVTDKQREVVELEACLIFLADARLLDAYQVLPILTYAKSQKKGLLIVASEVADSALATMIANRVQGNFPLCAVKTPKFGQRRREVLEDLRVCTGAKQIWMEESGNKLEAQEPSDEGFRDFFGVCERVIVTRDQTTLVGGIGHVEDIQTRISHLREELPTVVGQEETHLKDRIARLAGGVAVVHVPGRNDGEIQANKFLVEDAIRAGFSALRGGVVPAGGMAFRWALQQIMAEDISTRPQAYQTAWEIFERGLKELLMRLIANGLEGGIPADKTADVVAKLLTNPDPDFGYDLVNYCFRNFREAKLFEPADLAASVLRIGHGCSTTLGQTLVAITYAPEEKR